MGVMADGLGMGGGEGWVVGRWWWVSGWDADVGVCRTCRMCGDHCTAPLPSTIGAVHWAPAEMFDFICDEME